MGHYYETVRLKKSSLSWQINQISSQFYDPIPVPSFVFSTERYPTRLKGHIFMIDNITVYYTKHNCTVWHGSSSHNVTNRAKQQAAAAGHDWRPACHLYQVETGREIRQSNISGPGNVLF